MIKVENVSFKYEDEYVLKDLNFSVNEGEIIAIVGKNGSGKSTIGKLVSGIIKLKEGHIYIDDIDILNKKNIKLIRNKVGIVFQNPENQIIFNNIYDELAFSIKDVSQKEIEEKIENALSNVDMIKYKNHELYTLSLGQKQRIAIAETLVRNPKYIILDEPTSMIDSSGKHKIHEIIKKLKKSGYTIVCITNLAEEILFADRVLILDNGKIAHEIQKKDLLEKIDILKQYNIKEPTVLEILYKLKENGIKLDIKDFTVDNLVETIKERIFNEKSN